MSEDADLKGVFESGWIKCDKCAGSGAIDGKPCEACEGKGSTRVARMDFKRMLCDRHGEVFREDHPRGFAVFMVHAFQAIARILPAPAGLSTAQWTSWLELELDKKPACCRLPKDTLSKLLAESRKDWPKRFCFWCRNLVPGFRIKTKMRPDGPVNRRHVCFWCYVHHVAGKMETRA